MLTGTYKELLKPEFESFKLSPEHLEDSSQVVREINALQAEQLAIRNICIFLWIIISTTGLSCFASILCELIDLPALFSDPAIKGCMVSLMGFVPMLVFYTFKKTTLDKKMLLLQLLKAESNVTVNA